MPMKDLPPKARAEAQALLDDYAALVLEDRLAPEPPDPKRPVGRPEVGPMVNVRMPEELIAWVDEQVAERGSTRAAFIRDVLQAAKETDTEVVEGEVVNDEEAMSPKPPSQRIASVPFPTGGISDKTDVTAYNVSDLKRVADNLIRRATPTEAAALRKLFATYAQRAERKLS